MAPNLGPTRYTRSPVDVSPFRDDAMSEYSIPFIHPLVVHFPIALMPAAAVVLVGWLVRDRAQWLVVALWLQVAGVAGALTAVWSGEALAESVEGEPMVEILGPSHEALGEWALRAALAVLAVVVISLVWHRRNVNHPGVPVPWRAFVAILGLAAAALVLWTGHMGGTMVWGVPK